MPDEGLTIRIGGNSAEAVAAVNALTGAITKLVGVAKQSGDEVGSAAKKKADALDKLGQRAAALQQGFQHLAIGAVALVTPLALATKQAIAFDAAMRNVDSIAKLSPANFERLSAEVLKLARDPNVTQGPTLLAQGLYDIQSAGFEGEKGLEALRESATTATAGMTDTATAARVLTAVMNSGVPGVKSFREASDVLFRTVDLGVVTFEELAHELGPTLPLAARARVSIQELGAAFIVMTKNGISASESATAIRGLLTQIVSPSKEATKALGEHAGILSINNLRAVGLAGVLQQLRQAFHGNDDELVKIIPEVRALMAAFSLAQNGGKDYARALNEVTQATDGAGAKQAALDRILPSTQAKWAKLRAEMEALGVELGTKMLPELNHLLDWAGKHSDLVLMGAKIAGLTVFVKELTQAAVAFKQVGLFEGLSQIGSLKIGAGVVGGAAGAAAGAEGAVVAGAAGAAGVTVGTVSIIAALVVAVLAALGISIKTALDTRGGGKGKQLGTAADLAAQDAAEAKRFPNGFSAQQILKRQISEAEDGPGGVYTLPPFSRERAEKQKEVDELKRRLEAMRKADQGPARTVPVLPQASNAGLPTAPPPPSAEEQKKAAAARKALQETLAQLRVDALPEGSIRQRRDKDLASLRLEEQGAKDKLTEQAKAAGQPVSRDALLQIERHFLTERQKVWQQAEADLKALREKAGGEAYRAAEHALGQELAQMERRLEQRRRLLAAAGHSDSEIERDLAQKRVDYLQAKVRRDDAGALVPGGKPLPPLLREDRLEQPLFAAQEALRRITQQQQREALDTRFQELEIAKSLARTDEERARVADRQAELARQQEVAAAAALELHENDRDAQARQAQWMQRRIGFEKEAEELRQQAAAAESARIEALSDAERQRQELIRQGLTELAEARRKLAEGAEEAGAEAVGPGALRQVLVRRLADTRSRMADVHQGIAEDGDLREVGERELLRLKEQELDLLQKIKSLTSTLNAAERERLDTQRQAVEQANENLTHLMADVDDREQEVQERQAARQGPDALRALLQSRLAERRQLRQQLEANLAQETDPDNERSQTYRLRIANLKLEEDGLLSQLEGLRPKWQRFWRGLGQEAADALKGALAGSIEDALMGRFDAKRVLSDLRQILARGVATAATEGISGMIGRLIRGNPRDRRNDQRPGSGVSPSEQQADTGLDRVANSAERAAAALDRISGSAGAGGSLSSALGQVPGGTDPEVTGDVPSGDGPGNAATGLKGVAGKIQQNGAGIAMALAGIIGVFNQGKNKLLTTITSVIQLLGSIPMGGGGGTVLSGIFGGIGKMFGFDSPLQDSQARELGFQTGFGTSRAQVGRWGFDFGTAWGQGLRDAARGQAQPAVPRPAGGGERSVVVNATQNYHGPVTVEDQRRGNEDLGWVVQRRLRTLGS